MLRWRPRPGIVVRDQAAEQPGQIDGDVVHLRRRVVDHPRDAVPFVQDVVVPDVAQARLNRHGLVEPTCIARRALGDQPRQRCPRRLGVRAAPGRRRRTAAASPRRPIAPSRSAPASAVPRPGTARSSLLSRPRPRAVARPRRRPRTAWHPSGLRESRRVRASNAVTSQTRPPCSTTVRPSRVALDRGHEVQPGCPGDRHPAMDGRSPAARHRPPAGGPSGTNSRPSAATPRQTRAPLNPPAERSGVHRAVATAGGYAVTTRPRRK